MEKTTQRSVTASLEGVPYTTRVTARGLELIADEPTDHGGQDLGLRPHELLLSGLAACTAITLRMYAARKQWPLEAVDVRLRYSRRDGSGTTIVREVVLEGALDADQRARLLEIAEKCPIHRLLTGEVVIETSAA